MNDQALTDYLTQIDSPPGLFLWLCMLIAFLTGFIIAYLLRSGKVRRLKRELREVRQEAEANHTLLVSAQEQLKQRNLELQEESREKVSLMERVRSAEDQRQQQLSEVVTLNERLEDMQAASLKYNHTIKELNSQILALKNQEAELPDSSSTTVTTGGGGNTAEEVGALRERLNAFEQSLERLERENDTLKSDLDTLKAQPAGSTVVKNDPGTDDPEEPTMVIQSDKTVLYDKIIVADRDKDDLTAIEGVGEFLEKKLNSIGVFSYEQIGNWTSSQIDRVTQQIGYIPGRIEKDNWVGQAALLIQQGEREEPTTEYSTREMDGTQAQIDAYSRAEMDTETPDATDQEEQEPTKEAVSRADYQPDNLKIVEGIGPKIEEILKGAGIGNLEALGSADPGRLREIMEDAGDQYQMHNPYTWPLQARLAASGRWEEFDQYQEELKGGK